MATSPCASPEGEATRIRTPSRSLSRRPSSRPGTSGRVPPDTRGTRIPPFSRPSWTRPSPLGIGLEPGWYGSIQLRYPRIVCGHPVPAFGSEVARHPGELTHGAIPDREPTRGGGHRLHEGGRNLSRDRVTLPHPCRLGVLGWRPQGLADRGRG